MIHDWLRHQFIYECAGIIAEHSEDIQSAARRGNEEAIRMHFECIRLVARDLEKTLREIELQVEAPQAKEAA
jgi:hypothetical protein